MRSLVLGNGNILVCLNQFGQVRDFYFPNIGLENHTGGRYFHRLGFWVDGQFSWIDDGSWQINVDFLPETMVGIVHAVNNNLGLVAEFNDVVYNEKNIFIRKVKITNLADRKRQVKVFFHQVFELYESHRGDTAYYDPLRQVIVHYKGRRIFLVSGQIDDGGFDEYSIGLYGIEGKEGTFKDAEDGQLSKNPIEHGKVDSVISFVFDLESGQEKTLYYWVTVAKLMKEVHELNLYIQTRTPEHLLKTTQDFWRAWVNRQKFTFLGLDDDVVKLFKKSALIMRSHVDNNGAILASGDSDMLEHGRDTYVYVWPRDGAFSALALDRMGDPNVAKRFFDFCNDVITPEGYFLHKYRPDKALGSSWHPWVKNAKVELPIQEDETAEVIYALWRHYELSKDLEFIETLYNSLIKAAADFMVNYRDKETNLPKASYDLWEEKFGVTTYTAATVYGAIIAAARFAKLLGKEEAEEKYNKAASEVKEAILNHLYDKETSIFYKALDDKTIDVSSAYGLFRFGVLEPTDKKLKKFFKIIEQKLACPTQVGGIARYEDDRYYQISRDCPGNPWIITTMWLAQYYIALANSEEDLGMAKKWLRWTTKYASPSSILPEQLNPYTGDPISAAPLTWSHAEYILTVLDYLDKLDELGICEEYCNPVK